MKYAFILGKNKDLSIAELAGLLGAKIEVTSDRSMVLYEGELPKTLIADGSVQRFLNKLGGCTQILEIFAENLDVAKIENVIMDYFENKAHGVTNIGGARAAIAKKADESSAKFPFAINILPENKKSQLLKFLLPRVKKNLRNLGIKANFMNKNFQNVNEVFAFKQGLAKRGTWVNIIETSGEKMMLGTVGAQQNFESYSKRDYGKPFRDAEVGMIPPKLAQVMINLCGGISENSSVIFDPFCGTGTILMEAMLMEYSVVGSDKEGRMAEGCKQNLAWLQENYPSTMNVMHEVFEKEAGAVERADFETFPFDSSVFSVVTEPDLGTALSQFPAQNFLEKEIEKLSEKYFGFLKNIHGILASGAQIVMIFPYWRKSGAEGGSVLRVRLFERMIARIKTLGYIVTEFAPLKSVSLFYDRPDQIVGREIVRLVKK